MREISPNSVEGLMMSKSTTNRAGRHLFPGAIISSPAQHSLKLSALLVCSSPWPTGTERTEKTLDLSGKVKQEETRQRRRNAGQGDRGFHRILDSLVVRTSTLPYWNKERSGPEHLPL